MQKTVEKKFLDFETIAFELVALNTPFYWERILVIGCEYVNSLKTPDTVYSLSKSECLMQPIQKQLSQNQKKFSQILSAFPEST